MTRLAPSRSRAVAVAEATNQALDRWGMLWVAGLILCVGAGVAHQAVLCVVGLVAFVTGWIVLGKVQGRQP